MVLVATKRSKISWCFYDWANSAFPAIISTFIFSTYFAGVIAPDKEQGMALWGQMTSVVGIIIAILSPFLGAIADYRQRRKSLLFFFTVVNIVATAGLWFALPGQQYVMIALLLAGIATIGFEIATVFYNSLLPSLVAPSHIGRLSGWGWALGYAGGLCSLVICMLLFIQPENPLGGLDKVSFEHVRATNLVCALWVLLFSGPIFLFVKEERKRSTESLWQVAKIGFKNVWLLIRKLPQYKEIAWFLLAKMIYIDGLNTLFAFGGIYAAGQFGMDTAEVLIFGILLNITAGIGAFGFAWIDDIFGSRRTIIVSLLAVLILGFCLVIITDKMWFYILGMMIGLFFGPIQSASRTMLVRLSPPEMISEFFGLYSLAGKATAFLGPAVLSFATLAFNSQRAGMATVLVFIFVGLVLMALMPLLHQQPQAARIKG